MDADILMILTEVTNVAVNFNTPQQENPPHMTLAKAGRYVREGQFAPGSMLPKVQAAMKFVRSNPSRRAIITSLDQAEKPLHGEAGTQITFA